MRIVFDVYWWTKGPISLRRVLRGLTFAWRSEFPEDEITLIVRRRHGDPADVPNGVQVVSS